MTDTASTSSRPLKGWWTLIFSAGVALVGVAQTFDWTSVIAPAYVGPVMIVFGLAGAALRGVTNTPVGSSTAPLA